MTMRWRVLTSRKSGWGLAPEWVDALTDSTPGNARRGLAPEWVDPLADDNPGSAWRDPRLRSAGLSVPTNEAAQRQLVRQKNQVQASGTAHAAGQKLAEVARGSTLNLVGAGVAAITTIIITLLVTRTFSRPVAGAFFSATSLFLIVESVASLGAFTGLVYFITRLRLLGEEGRIGTIIRAAVIPVLAVAATGTVALAVFASPLAHALLGGHLGNNGASPSAMAAALRALAVTLPFAALLDTLLGASRGYRDMRPTVVINQVSRSAIQLAGVTIAAVAGSAALLAPLWAVPYIPAVAVAWIWLRRIRRKKTSVRPSRPDESEDTRLVNATPRGFWRFTTPRAVASLAQITIQRIDIVLVAILRGPAEAAVYTAATRFLVAGQLGNAAISMAAQPQFTELYTIGATRRANVLYQVTTGWLVLLTWPLYLLAVVYGPQFLALFGHTYSAGYTVLIILAIASLVSAVCGQVDMVLITTGRSSWSLVNGLLAMVVNVSIDLLLIPRYGITGAAIGWAAAIGVANIMPLIQLAAKVRLNPFGRVTFLASSLCAISFYAVPLALRYALGGGLPGIAAALAVGCIVLTIGLWWFRDSLQLSVMPGLSYLMRRFP